MKHETGPVPETPADADNASAASLIAPDERAVTDTHTTVSTDAAPPAEEHIAPTGGWGEWAVTVAIAAAGVTVLVDGLLQKPSMSASGVGADFLPKIIGPLLIVLAIALAVQLFRGKYGEPEQAEGDVDLRTTQWIPLVVSVAALVIFVFAVEPVGYIITTTVVFWIIAWAMGARKYLTSLLIGFILATVIYFVFTRLLSIHLPGGVLEYIPFLEGII